MRAGLEKLAVTGMSSRGLTVVTVFIETTVVSYPVANRSRDLVLAAHQEATQEWWAASRPRYRCVTPEKVLREASGGGDNS